MTAGARKVVTLVGGHSAKWWMLRAKASLVVSILSMVVIVVGVFLTSPLTSLVGIVVAVSSLLVRRFMLDPKLGAAVAFELVNHYTTLRPGHPGLDLVDDRTGAVLRAADPSSVPADAWWAGSSDE